MKKMPSPLEKDFLLKSQVLNNKVTRLMIKMIKNPQNKFRNPQRTKSVKRRKEKMFKSKKSKRIKNEET